MDFELPATLVYRVADQSRGRIQRLALFSDEHPALALRGPIIYLLTTFFSINYLISNLISLVLLTVLDFYADSMIWGIRNRNSGELKPVYAYDIHNIISVVSEGAARA